MSADPSQDSPEEVRAGKAGPQGDGKSAHPPPPDEPAEPSSPPCFLHELPHPSGDQTPPEQESVSELTPEEQMERFEKSLKEDDWGHQPC